MVRNERAFQSSMDDLCVYRLLGMFGIGEIMSGLTGKIEHFLLDLLDKSEDGTLEIGRNELAEYFNCAPSQINYVLKSRFTSYKGYYIES